MRSVLALLVASLLFAAPDLAARASGRSAPRARSSAPRSNKCSSCARSSSGKIQRSRTAVRSFQKSNPCPSTGKTSGACSGYVVDHVVPLKRGGADTPSNMQWQTKAAAKAKDRVE